MQAAAVERRAMLETPLPLEGRFLRRRIRDRVIARHFVRRETYQLAWLFRRENEVVSLVQSLDAASPVQAVQEARSAQLAHLSRSCRIVEKLSHLLGEVVDIVGLGVQ